MKIKAIKPSPMYSTVKIKYVKIIKETEKALCLLFADQGSHWFPKSVVTLHENPKCVQMPWYFADQRALMQFEAKKAE